MAVDLVIAAITGVFAIFFLIQTAQIPESNLAASVGPTFWPNLLLGLMLALAVVLAVQTLLNGKKVTAGAGQESREEAKGADYPQNLWITLLLLVAYSYLMNIIGFVVATPLFLGITSWLMGMKRLKLLIPVTLLLSLGLIYLFPITLYVPLPRGIGFFRTISLFFY